MTEAIFFHITNTCVYIMSQTTRICLYKNQTTLPRCSLGPANGPPLLRGFACRLRRHQRTAPVPVSARLARANAACARPSLRRRPGPPPPAHGAAPRLRFLRVTWSYGSPLGCSVWACGPPSAPLRVRLRPFCALPSLVPRSVGRLGGLRAPLLPPGAWSGPAGRFFTAPAPGDGSRCSQGLASGFWLAQAGRLPPALCQLCQLILLASTGNLFVSYNGNG